VNLLDVVREVRRHLEENGRLSLRMLRRQFELDDSALEEVIEELVDVQRVAKREENALAWSGSAATEPRGPQANTSSPARDPLSYTPKHLAEEILTSRSALEGERKQVTVLFADVKGSMDLAEQVDPEEWHKIMDRFFAILSEGVHRFEGPVDGLTGDGITALFGVFVAAILRRTRQPSPGSLRLPAIRTPRGPRGTSISSRWPWRMIATRTVSPPVPPRVAATRSSGEKMRVSS